MDPFIGEIRIFGFNYPPVNWATCNGQVVALAQNQVLYAVIGTTYGAYPPSGNVQGYHLPNLQGCTGMGMGMGQGPSLTPRQIASTGGANTVGLSAVNFPPHQHTMKLALPPANPTGYVGIPSNTVLPARENTAQLTFSNLNNADSQMSSNSIGATGGGQVHNNQQPFLVLNFCIALQGVFPVRP